MAARPVERFSGKGRTVKGWERKLSGWRRSWKRRRGEKGKRGNDSAKCVVRGAYRIVQRPMSNDVIARLAVEPKQSRQRLKRQDLPPAERQRPRE